MKNEIKLFMYFNNILQGMLTLPTKTCTNIESFKSIYFDVNSYILLYQILDC